MKKLSFLAFIAGLAILPNVVLAQSKPNTLQRIDQGPIRNAPVQAVPKATLDPNNPVVPYQKGIDEFHRKTAGTRIWICRWREQIPSPPSSTPTFGNWRQGSCGGENGPEDSPCECGAHKGVLHAELLNPPPPDVPR